MAARKHPELPSPSAIPHSEFPTPHWPPPSRGAWTGYTVTTRINIGQNAPPTGYTTGYNQLQPVTSTPAQARPRAVVIGNSHPFPFCVHLPHFLRTKSPFHFSLWEHRSLDI